MSSYWTPINSFRESDYYRPNMTLNHDRPPRPGPRQPDCWRPTQMTVSSQIHIKQEDSSQSLKPDNKKQTVKPDPILGLRKQVTGPTDGESSKTSETKDAVNKRKVKSSKPPNPNKEPLARLRGGFSGNFYDGARFESEADQLALNRDHNKDVDGLEANSKEESKNTKALNSGYPKFEQPGKRQMGVINSIMRVEEQKVNTTRPEEARDSQLAVVKTGTLTTEQDTRLDATNEDLLASVSTPDCSRPSTPQNHERPPCRRLPYPRDGPIATTQWSRTTISAGLGHPVGNVPISPALNLTLHNSNAGQRQKLDFGNRIDQCLLKMDKWADAWLTNALADEDPNPDTDNAWNSFEYCLGMPDILEEGEIVEYEEVPRQALPVEVAATQNQILEMKRKRKWDEVEPAKGRERVSKTNRKSWTMESSMMLSPPTMVAQPESASYNVDTNGKRIPASPTEDARWRDTRENVATEFRSSSSPEDKKMKVVHIPSAAMLREEALRNLM